MFLLYFPWAFAFLKSHVHFSNLHYSRPDFPATTFPNLHPGVFGLSSAFNGSDYSNHLTPKNVSIFLQINQDPRKSEGLKNTYFIGLSELVSNVYVSGNVLSAGLDHGLRGWHWRAARSRRYSFGIVSDWTRIT